VANQPAAAPETASVKQQDLNTQLAEIAAESINGSQDDEW
jgi:hypothetical protein